MGIKNAIIDVLKKIKCKCKCFGSIEVEIKGCDTPPEIEPHREITTNNNNNNLNVENNIAINSPRQSPRQSPHHSPMLHRPLPVIPNEYVIVE